MCGDGANDCGALKAAHAGIALTDTEASVASPFTSRNPSIACVPELIRQGRCSLVTSFGIFKYMAVYSMIQFISVIILYESSVNLSENQFLYVDFFIICSLSAVFGYTEPHKGPLFKRPPLTSLLSLPPIGSLLIQTVFICFIQLMAYFTVIKQDWFVPYTDRYNTSGLETLFMEGGENYAVVGVSFSQYIFLALAYAKGKPFRRNFMTNYWFAGTLFFWAVFSTYLLIYPCSFLGDWIQFDTDLIPMDFRLIILGYSLCQIVACLLLEEFVVDRGFSKLMGSKFWKKWNPPKEKHVMITRDLNKDNRWPALHSETNVSTKNDCQMFSPPFT